MNDQQWKQRPVVVVGVGPGLGSALVRRFAKEGCAVAALARTGVTLNSRVEQLRQETGGEIQAYPCDATRPEAVSETFAGVRDWKGPVGGLIYNASGANWSGLLETEPGDFERAWRVTTWGALVCARAAAGDLLEYADGSPMLFTGATSSLRGRKHALGFSSAKFALRGMVQALAGEIWPGGVHAAHVVIDGAIDTENALEPGQVGPPDDPKLRPDDIAESFWNLATQPPSAWSLELDVRPRTEEFFV